MDKKAYQIIKISLLTENVGQVEGLPRNPRWIKDERYMALKKSIEDAPEFLEARMLLVYPHDGKYIVIAGNMRLKACKELGFKELPCYVFKEDTPVEKLREYTIKDNVEFGNIDWDCLANEWDTQELHDWGVDVPEFNDIDLNEYFKENKEETDKKEQKTTDEKQLSITITYNEEEKDELEKILGIKINGDTIDFKDLQK